MGQDEQGRGHEPIRTDRDSVLSAISSVFARAGMRSTRQRRLIAEALAGVAARNSDFSTEDLWIRLRQEDHTIGRATVYRAVDLLLEGGVLDRVALPDGTTTHRVCGGGHHHHVTCTQCRRIVAVDACLPREVVRAVSQSTDFEIDGHALELYGRCATCRQSGSASNN